MQYSKKQWILTMSRYIATYYAANNYAVIRECTVPDLLEYKNGIFYRDPNKKLRPDLVAVNHKFEIVIIETKSCPSDFSSDQKWRRYLPLCHKFYFASDPKTADYIESALQANGDKGIGIIEVTETGSSMLLDNVGFRKSASTHECKASVVEILWHMALRGSGFIWPGRLQTGNTFTENKDFWPSAHPFRSKSRCFQGRSPFL